MGLPVNGQNAALVCSVISNLTTTRQKLLYPSGAKWIALSYRLLPGATATAGQYAKVVLNAASDADADGKLALSGGWMPLYQGEDLPFDTTGVTRIDIIAAQAVGTESTQVRVIAGV